MDMRVGHGWDLHRLEEGRPCKVGGVLLPHPKGPVGHSDGDVLLHALADALLGAAGLGDIGLLFPNTAPRWKGADSAEILRIVMGKLDQDGWSLANADVTVVAEEPKVGAYRQAIRERVASILEVDHARVSVKAKTSEGLGDIGAGCAMACHAVVLLYRAGLS